MNIAEKVTSHIRMGDAGSTPVLTAKIKSMNYKMRWQVEGFPRYKTIGGSILRLIKRLFH